jgi:hypothetical protein
VRATVRVPPPPREPMPAAAPGEAMPADVAKSLRDMLRHHGRALSAAERRAIRWVLVAAGELGSLVHIPGALPREEP